MNCRGIASSRSGQNAKKWRLDFLVERECPIPWVMSDFRLSIADVNSHALSLRQIGHRVRNVLALVKICLQGHKTRF